MIGRAELGKIAGVFKTGPDRMPVVHPALSGELTLSYGDANGPQTVRKRLNIGIRFTL
jgi:hypothetical protein